MSVQSKLGRSAFSRLGRLHAAQRARCFYCKQALTLRVAGEQVSPQDATIDHFFPKSHGGPDGWSNWVLACRACNNNKASRQPTDEEMLDWNELASAWPYIRPLDLTLVRKKRCAVCQQWITPMRLGDSIKAGHETQTCRPRCGRGDRRLHRRPQAKEPERLQSWSTARFFSPGSRVPRPSASLRRLLRRLWRWLTRA